jgi:hypothetical protein
MVVSAAFSVTLFMNQLVAQQRVPPTDDEIEGLTRGPVHEAFAEMIVFDPEPGFVIPRMPPAAIEELPLENQPEGDNIAWIPGYWAWDDEKEDFVWLSGIWRAVPPERQWVPGYWAPSGKGAQWTSGFWADASLDEVEYLPEPPATVEAGPSVPTPSADYSWLSGSWVWQRNLNVWRPGYWARGQGDWNRIPARYVWTPRGYVFVNGFYDYNENRRGVLYAPVYFRSSVYTQESFLYSPVTVINPSVFTNHLFLRPSYGHYYFGDYYSSDYATQGFSPWFLFNNHNAGYDPFYVQQRWQHRADQQWNQRVASEYTRRRDHEPNPPPRDLRSQREQFARGGTGADDSFLVGTTLADLTQSEALPHRIQTLAPDARQQLGKRGAEIRALNEQRLKLESDVGGRTGVQPDSKPAPVRARIPRSTIVESPIQKLAPGKAPPKIIPVPAADPNVQPKPRPPRVEKGQSPLRGKGNDGEGRGKGGKGVGEEKKTPS